MSRVHFGGAHMKSWLWIPLAMVALVVAVPTSQGGGCRKKGCGSDCGPQQVIVGYRTEMRTVTVPEWVTETRKLNVTEYQTVAEKRTVTRYKSEAVTETRPVTFTVNEMQRRTRTEEYFICEAVTKPV